MAIATRGGGVFQALYSIPAARGFAADLDNASKELRKEVEKATRDTAFAVMRRAKAEASTFSDRGDLANNISAQGAGINWKVGIVDTSIPSRGGRNTAHWNPWVYGVWYELGFTTRKIAAHPFMAPAAAAEEAPHLERLDAAIGRTVKTGA